MSLENALLGFLQITPMTGYDMKKLFENAIASFWNAPQSQIYSVLRRLETEGSIEAEIIYQETKPNRKLYQITAEGEAKFRKWMSESHPPATNRNSFLLQLWFSGFIDDESIVKILVERVSDLQERIKQLEAKSKADLDHEDDPPRDRFFWWLTLNYGVQHRRFQIDWTEQMIERIRRGDYRNGKEGALRGLFGDAT